ncbi:MAG: ferrous iron transport protein A [Elusimicrobia bacterium]|nr:ferrous iron transport protein A [Elusimicrobiota bacterium]
MTLEQAALGARMRVVELADVSETEKARLSGLGLRRGASVIKLLSTPLRDPVECLVASQLLALERRLLKRIRVEAE